MLVTHGPSGLQWEEVYEDWKSDEYKYFWKNYDNPVVARDLSFGEKGFAEALELARAGDEHAIFSLQRTIRFDPDSEAAQAAREVLAEAGIAA